MGGSEARYKLTLLGAFRLKGPNGSRIDVSSKRGQALLAMLAVSGGGERTRPWLQERLWGSRGPEQSQASLRRELSTLRKLVNTDGADLLDADFGKVWMDLGLIEIDVRTLGSALDGEFLEGLDVAGEDLFEDWLREERQRIVARRDGQVQQHPAIPAPVPSAIDIGERPALAVLPFANATGDQANDLFAEGLSEDLIDRLSRLRWLPIIARSSSFALDAGVKDVRDVGRLLGARYVLEGQVRDNGGDFALSASLSDALSGETLWSNRVNLPKDPAADSLNQLLTGLTSSLDFRIDVAEQRRALSKPQSDLNVRELLWRGRWHLNRWTRDDADQARICFELALEREPNSPEALVQVAWVRLWSLWATRGSNKEFRDARKLAQRAIAADYDDARGYMLAGTAENWMRQPLRAEALLRHAIALNPSLVMAHVQLSCVRHMVGDHSGAIALLEHAIRLSPNDQDLFFTLGELARAQLFEGNYDQALLMAEDSLARRPGYWLIHVVRINALVRLDRLEEAAEAYSQLLALKPGFDISQLDWLDFMNAEMQDFLRNGLNLARASSDQGAVGNKHGKNKIL